MARRNTTFISGEPFWANACVGNNGTPGYWDYAKGFSQAANLLIDQVLQNQGLRHSVDEFIYPVCFNMRHSVELRLKGAITELILLQNYRGLRVEFDLEASHDIGNIWQFFVEKSRLVDDRYIAINRRLNTKIIDLAEVDSTGQTFRYPLNTVSQKHLVDVANINFVTLKESFSELEMALDELHRLNNYLYDEYSCRTLTNNLSRKNIFEIASILPPRVEWSKEEFDTTKAEIKELFNIGSRELSKSIVLIQNNFEAAPLIGVSVPLLGVMERDIIEFVDYWFKLHEQPSDQTEPIIVKSSDIMIESLVKDAKTQQEIWRITKPRLTPQVLAGLSTLFYFARELNFSELYVKIYESELLETNAASIRSEDEYRAKFIHILNKTNALYNILRTLYFLKKLEIAELLVTTYDLEQKFSWLNDARSGSLFKKPEYSGYLV